MSLSAYPVYLKKEKNGYSVRIPDFNQYTEGSDLAEAVKMARDEIGLMGMYYEDHALPIPLPFSAEACAADGEFGSIVDIDFDICRARNEGRLVKKNCTIPFYLEREAEKCGLNFSRVLTEALTMQLFGQNG